MGFLCTCKMIMAELMVSRNPELISFAALMRVIAFDWLRKWKKRRSGRWKNSGSSNLCLPNISPSFQRKTRWRWRFGLMTIRSYVDIVSVACHPPLSSCSDCCTSATEYLLVDDSSVIEWIERARMNAAEWTLSNERETMNLVEWSVTSKLCKWSILRLWKRSAIIYLNLSRPIIPTSWNP